MNRINRTNQALFEELVKQIRIQGEAAGIAVAIIDKNGETQYEKYFGCRDTEKQLPIDGDTIFGLASVTKSFVALAIMQLYERGLLDLEDPVSKFIPEFTNKNQETVRIHHLLSHSGGFYPVHRTVVKEIAEKLGITEETAGDLGFSKELAEAGARQVAEQLDSLTKENGLIGRPGEYMSYCNDGFGLLSEIVRRIGGEASFAEYVKKNILMPLGMERSGCEYLKPRLEENAATLYKKQDGVMRGSRDYYDNAFVLGGAGAMKSTISDMKKILYMYLNRGKTPAGGRILSMEGVRAMCRPRMEYRPESWYCFGLATKKLDDVTVVEHGGSLPGVSSNLSWSYDAGCGVIVLCNTSDVPVSVIADAAMRMYHGRNPIDNRDCYQEEAWTEETKRAAIGHYVSIEDSAVDIFETEEGMKIRVDGNEKNLIMVQENLGIVRGYVKDAYLTLFKDEDEKVFAIGFGGRMLPRK